MTLVFLRGKNKNKTEPNTKRIINNTPELHKLTELIKFLGDGNRGGHLFISVYFNIVY